MNIVHIIAWPGIGGSEKYALYLAEEARREGHSISFIFGENGPMVDLVKNKGFECRLIKMNSSFNPILVLGSALLLKRYLKNKKPDIVHTHMLREQSLAVFVRMLGGRYRLVRTFHRLDNFDWKMFFVRFLLNRYTSAYVAVSFVMKKKMSKNGFKNNVYVVENGVPKIIRKKEKESKAFGFLGRISKEKGVLELVENWPKGWDGLIIGGGGPQLKELELTIKNKKNKNINALGQVEDVSNFFEKIDVLVLPSKTEVMPMVVAEAFSCGVPVVSFDIPGMKENLGSGGVVAPEGDYKELIRALKKVKDNLDKYSKNAKKIYREKYTVEKMWQETEAVYKLSLDKN